MFYKILEYFKYSGNSEKHHRQYRLIHYVTWELVTVCAIIITLYFIAKLWFLVMIISLTIGIALINLYILALSQNTVLCSNILALIIFIAIAGANYLIWGIGPVHSQWFYVMPILAASLTGMYGLFIYSIISLGLLVGYGHLAIPPYYQLPSYQLVVIEWLNHVFAYLIIVTTLANLIHENQRYEQELNDKNYLLQAEKNRYHYLARFDPLTNLPNRRYFIQIGLWIAMIKLRTKM